MSATATGLDATDDDAILDFEVSDEALETAAGRGKQNMANPTVPSAIICLPFAD